QLPHRVNRRGPQGTVFSCPHVVARRANGGAFSHPSPSSQPPGLAESLLSSPLKDLGFIVRPIFSVPRAGGQMTSIRTVARACMTTAMMALPLAANGQTGPRNQDTYFTFSQPVELPNATLPAGTYLFQLVDSASNRHIVRVMTKDRQKVYTT